MFTTSVRCIRVAAVVLAVPVLLSMGCDSVVPVDQAGGRVVIDLGALHGATIDGQPVACLSVAHRIRLDVEVGGVPVRLFKQITPGAATDTMMARGVEGETRIRFEILSSIDTVLFEAEQTVAIDEDFGLITFDDEAIRQRHPVLKVCPTGLDLTAGDSTFWVVNQNVSDEALDWTFRLLEEPCDDGPCVRASVGADTLAEGEPRTTEAGTYTAVKVASAYHRGMRMTAQVEAETVGAVRFEILSGSTVSPLAAVDDTFEVVGEGVLPVLDNDTLSFPEETVLRVVLAPTHGTAGLTGDGRHIVYEPADGFDGTDSLVYRITERARSDTAMVVLRVRFEPPEPLLAADDTARTNAESPVAIRVLSNDEPDSVRVEIAWVGSPGHGTAVQSGRQIVYTPDGRFAGEDRFAYQIREESQRSEPGTVVVHVRPVARDDSATTFVGVPKQIDVLANDTPSDRTHVNIRLAAPPDNGEAVVEGDRMRYTPDRGFVGSDRFRYVLSGGGRDTASAQVVIEVQPDSLSGLHPVAVDDTATTAAGESVVIRVLANDRPDSARLAIARVGAPGRGTAVREGERIRYTPEPGFVGRDRFLYVITDGERRSEPARVVVDVRPAARVADYAWIEKATDFPRGCAAIHPEIPALEALRDRLLELDDELESDDRWGVEAWSFVVPYDSIATQIDALTCGCTGDGPRPACGSVDETDKYRCATSDSAPLTTAADALLFFKQLPPEFQADADRWIYTLERLYPYPDCFDVNRVVLEQAPR